MGPTPGSEGSSGTAPAGNGAARPAAARSTVSLPLDLLLGWFIPGAGHFSRGFARQGRITLAVVVLLFASGLTLSDLEAVSRDLHPYAFWAQLGVAGGTLPLLAIDPAREKVLSDYESVHQPVAVPARNDTGVLFCCIAGLLNLLALFDLADRTLSRSRVVPGGSP